MHIAEEKNWGKKLEAQDRYKCGRKHHSRSVFPHVKIVPAISIIWPANKTTCIQFHNRVNPLIQAEIWLWVGCFAYNTYHIQQIFGACLHLVWGSEQRTFCIISIRAKLSLAPLGMPKWVQPSMNQYKVLRLNLHTDSKHAPKPCWTWRVSYARQPTPDQISSRVTG